VYLTNRKRAYGTWDWCMDTFCCCFKGKDSDDEEMKKKKKKLDDNVKIIDMFIFSEANMLY
jgi:hypothetical protein